MYFVFIIFGAILIFYIYKLITGPHNHWRNKNVKFVQPKPILGNMEIIHSVSFTELTQQWYNQFPNDRYFGFYQFITPILMLKDPKLIKQICVKEFDSFTDHVTFSSEDIDPLWSRNLVQMCGDKWKKMRTKLSPAFTSSKMRSMFVLIEACSKQLIDYIKNQNQIVYETEMKDICSRFANDVIATCAFGIECDSFKQQKNEFFLMGQKGTNITGTRALIFFLSSVSLTLMRVLRLKIIPSDVNDFFAGIICDTLKLRRDKGIVRQDMINLLLQAQKGKLKHEDNSEVETGFNSQTDNENLTTITDQDIAAQAFIFFLAGFDTVSTLLCFTVYELAVNPDIQMKLIQEIKENCDEEIKYETIMKLKYLDMVISETLRKWPPVAISDRKVTKDFIIQPENDGESPILLKKDSLCWLPIYAIHRDPRYFSDPDKFDPERFSDENKQNIDSSAYIPFGMGPRICIGSRFALLETKLLLVNLLKEFEIVPVQRTKIPLELNKDDFNPSSAGGLWLGFKQRNQ